MGSLDTAKRYITSKLNKRGNSTDDLGREACLPTGGRKSGKIIRMGKANEKK